MKKSILNLGKVLNKAAQKEVFGGLSVSESFCENRCETATKGLKCYSLTLASLSVCDGEGGFIAF